MIKVKKLFRIDKLFIHVLLLIFSCIAPVKNSVHFIPNICTIYMQKHSSNHSTFQKQVFCATKV